jgi:accessory gene regulator protein AgrB
VPYTESQNLTRLKEEKNMKRKVKSMLIIFFYIKEIIHKGFVLAGQTVNSAYRCGILWQLCENV